MQNPSFDDWSNGLPKLWKGNKNFVAQSFDRIDGSSAVAVRGITDVYPLRNEIRPDFTNPDKTKLYNQKPTSTSTKSFSTNPFLMFIPKSGTTKSLLELGQYTPGQIAQVVVGIKRDKDYTLTFLTKGGRGQASIDYSYKDNIKTATPLNRKHTISKAFGPNNSYTQVMISFHTNPGLRNGTATLTFMAVGEETVLIDNVVLKETAN